MPEGTDRPHTTHVSPPGAESAPAPVPARPSSPLWTLHLWQIQPVRDALLIAAVLALVYLGYKLSIVTVPILLAMLLAYLIEPAVKFVTPPRRRWFTRRGFALVLIFGAFLLVVIPAAASTVSTPLVRPRTTARFASVMASVAVKQSTSAFGVMFDRAMISSSDGITSPSLCDWSRA
ncbi:MAG: hypothetical protein K2Q09_07070, partial [Phycisphaerales bacterium]|nr:hypothetical protein [Phycisphaerales bacterium]